MRGSPGTLAAGASLWTFLISASALAAFDETPSLKAEVEAGRLPPVAKRVPAEPSVVKFDGKSKQAGRHGGKLNILMGRAKDVRQMVVYGYARLVGYDEKFNIVPDILKSVDVKDGRRFTLNLRKGHRWSDGHPFTAEDFRYWWEDMATDPDISKLGPPVFMLVNGKPPKFEVIDETTVRYTWDAPHPKFLPLLAGARPEFIYRPAHYMKQFHAKHQDAAKLAEMVKAAKRRNWVSLHFRYDRPYKNDNPDFPSLQPWVQTTKPPAKRFVFKRNPYFHRVDERGRQLPYVDEVIVTVASSKLISPKAGTGDTDLQARGIALKNFPYLKKAEKRNNYTVKLWPTAKGAHMALFPNMNHADPVWRKLFRDVRFRRALSLAIDRRQISKLIYFGLASPTGNSVLPESQVYKKKYAERWAKLDIKKANALLDEVGLKKAGPVRRLPDGRPLEITVETSGEELEQTDILRLVKDTWAKIGVKMLIKPSQREVLRNRVFAGSTQVAVWFGLENGIPTADSSPSALAPTSQQHLQWPKWGQYTETKGKAGEPVDMEGPRKLMELNEAWNVSTSKDEKAKIWHRMLDHFTDQVYTIGLISRVPQPVVVNARLRNVPKKAIYNWEPGAHFGVYRPDTFWFAGK